MNSSLWSADRATHIKIVLVSLVAAIIMVGVGIGARSDNPSATNLTAKVNGPVLKASKASSITANDVSRIR